jgi:pimeloyl-ACP methyl ester carboxylesterase
MLMWHRSSALTAIAVFCAACAPPKDAATADSLAAASPAPAATSLASAPDRTLTRGDVTINYRVLGAGEPVLLVHGYGDNLKMWSGFLADSLARDHRVLAIDARAFGKSGKPAGADRYGFEMIDDLVALLDHEQVAKVHVVGYSMGAMLAAQLALVHPERVRTATMAAGMFAKDSAALHAMVAPWVADLRQGRRLTKLIRDVVPTLPDSVALGYSDQLFAESDSAALLGVLESFPRLSVDWTKVATSKVPAIAIVGADDPLRPYAAALAAMWPGMKHIEVPATDHTNIFASPVLLTEVRTLLAANPIR